MTESKSRIRFEKFFPYASLLPLLVIVATFLWTELLSPCVSGSQFCGLLEQGLGLFLSLILSLPLLVYGGILYSKQPQVGFNTTVFVCSILSAASPFLLIMILRIING